MVALFRRRANNAIQTEGRDRRRRQSVDDGPRYRRFHRRLARRRPQPDDRAAVTETSGRRGERIQRRERRDGIVVVRGPRVHA